MRGLNNEELDRVQRAMRVCRGKHAQQPQIVGHQANIAEALVRRGCLQKSTCVHDDRVTHYHATAAGRDAVACELAARGAYVL